MHSIIRIGSRDSALAVAQAEIIRSQIKKSCPRIQVELITMKTTGDKILDKSLDKIGGKGLFVKELDQALLDERIDLSVHSLKDMPMEVSKELPILVYGKREDPRDVMVFSPNQGEISKGGMIGTSSKRRMIQLRTLYPEATFCGIRGNVQTRLHKLETKGVDGIVLAAAGLNRLGLKGLSGRIFEVDEVVPAAGQGVLAIQGRRGENYSWLSSVNHEETAICSRAERRFVAELDGGCTSPIAAYGSILGEELKLTGLYYRGSDDTYYIESIVGDKMKAEKLGETLAISMGRKWGE